MRIGLQVAEIVLAIIGIVFLFGLFFDPLYSMSGWIIVAMLYIFVGSCGLYRQSKNNDMSIQERFIKPSRLSKIESIYPYITSTVGFMAAFLATAVKSHDDDGTRNRYAILAGIVIICSWTILHSAFARTYARIFYSEGGLEFPQTQAPRELDFIYFSFTIGTAFATSDVQVTNRRMRYYVLAHAVASFFYNAAVVAIAISVLTGNK